MLTAHQVNTLEKTFQANPYLEINDIHQLARSLNLSEIIIQRWYGKRRFKCRQEGTLGKGQGQSTKY